jgi:hypothetical protein
MSADYTIKPYRSFTAAVHGTSDVFAAPTGKNADLHRKLAKRMTMVLSVVRKAFDFRLFFKVHSWQCLRHYFCLDD